MSGLQKAEISVYSPELESFSVETPGGRIHIRWDCEASATPNAQLAFFAEFLATAGVYESWVQSCPLTYTSGNASRKRDVLGTWFLSILAGRNFSPASRRLSTRRGFWISTPPSRRCSASRAE